MRYSTLIFFLILFCPVFAFAQSMALPINPPSAQEDEYKKVKDEYIEEAQRFFEQCGQDYTLKQYYDCECLAVKYLDDRIASGPDKNSQNILMSIRGYCHDATIAAGETYSSCMTDGTIFPPGQTAEQYCTCFANTFAKLFNESGRIPSSRTSVFLQTQAHIKCDPRGND